MASIQKTKNGYRVQIAIRGVRENSSFHTKREAESWAARRETEIRDSKNLSPGSKHTLVDAFRRYAEEVSPTKRGERWEILRLQAFESHALPLKKMVDTIEPDDMATWRDSRLAVVNRGTVLREISLLSAVFESMRREWRWIEKNPLRDMRKPAEPDHREIVITRWQIKMMLGPVVLLLSLFSRKESGLHPSLSQMVPWFIVGFLLLMVLRSFGFIPQFAIKPAQMLANFLTIMSMAALGLGVDARSVLKVGGRVTAVVILSLLVLSVISFGLIKLLGIA